MRYVINTPVAGRYYPVRPAQVPGVELGILKLRTDEHRLIHCERETIFDLLTGQLHISWDGSGCAEVISRKDPLREAASPLHVPGDTWVTLACMSPGAEVALVQLDNTGGFAPRLQHPGEGSGPLRQREGASQIYPFAVDAAPGTQLTVGEATLPGTAPGEPPVEPRFHPLARTDAMTWFGIWCDRAEGPGDKPSGIQIRKNKQDKEKT